MPHVNVGALVGAGVGTVGEDVGLGVLFAHLPLFFDPCHAHKVFWFLQAWKNLMPSQLVVGALVGDSVGGVGTTGESVGRGVLFAHRPFFLDPYQPH